MAKLLTFGDQAPTVGGDFERECCGRLRDELPDGVVVAANIELPRGGGSFYELDAIVSAPGFCDLLELKCLRPHVDVKEDLITTPQGYQAERVFSLADRKAKVLAGRLRRAPFSFVSVPRVHSVVVIPDGTSAAIHHADYRTNPPPLKQVSEFIKDCRERIAQNSLLGDPQSRVRNQNGWMALHATGTAQRSSHSLGRFTIRRPLGVGGAKREYVAIDEAPCRVDVHLREYPFDPTLPSDLLKITLDSMAREFKILRRIRHPNITCVIGHFQTGSSWVQVSDWFDGKTLDEAMPLLKELPLVQRIGIFNTVIAGLQFCHEKGVFHRNLDGQAVLLGDDLQEVRVCGFEYAFDVAAGSSITSGRLSVRDERIVPPEELVGGTSRNLRLGDVFQSGVLLHRLGCGGEWPFDSSLAYTVSEGKELRRCEAADSQTRQVLSLAQRMMSIDPTRRPDMLARVEMELQSLRSS